MMDKDFFMTKVFAHRGYSAKYPENTMLAFEKAIEAGCDGIELDVQLSADGEMVVIHDEDVRRTTNGSGMVADLTLAELRALDAGEGEKIPLLSEYFGLAAGFDIITNVELKNDLVDYIGLEEKVVALVHERGLSERVIISSFNLKSVDKVKRLAPAIPCGYLFASPDTPDPDTPDWESVVESMRAGGVEFIHPGADMVDEDFLEVVRRRGVPFGVWTVNDAAFMRRLIDAGAYSVFTDDPLL